MSDAAPGAASCARSPGAARPRRMPARRSRTSRADARAPRRCSPRRRSSATRASSCCPSGASSAQLALRDASVLVVGAGALGAPVALYLAGAGVGPLGHRRLRRRRAVEPAPPALHFTPDVGVPKVGVGGGEAALPEPGRPRRALPGARRTRTTRAALVEGQDLVVDCSDSFATRYAVNAACCEAGVHADRGRRASGWTGLVMTIRPGADVVLPLRLPGRARGRAVLRRGGRARPGGGRDRLAAGARGAEAADRRGRAAARRVPADRPRRRSSSCASPSSRGRECPDCGVLVACTRRDAGSEHHPPGRRRAAPGRRRRPRARSRGARRLGAPRSSRAGRGCTRCSPTASRTRCAAGGRAGRAARARLRLARRDRDRDPPGGADRRRAVHRPRHGRRDRRDGRGRRQRDDLPGRDARRHRLRHRQAPSDGAGQRDDRLRGEAARPDHDRPRREDRRQHGRHPRRAAELHRRRQPGPSRARRGPQARGAGRRLGAPARPDRRRAQAAGARAIAELEREVADAARRGARRAGRGRPAAHRRAARARPAGSLAACAASRTVDIPQPPAEVFPWLLEQDKVPRGRPTSSATSRRRARSASARGSTQELSVAGGRSRSTLEITRYEPPRGAETRFETNGVEVVKRLRARARRRRHAAHADARGEGERRSRRGC